MPQAEIERRVDEALGAGAAQGQADKLPGQLSGGQQQRVAIARAIVIEPPLVLMDEPLSNLDAKLRLEMRAEIRRIHNTLGATTIYVTHDQEEALSLADRIVVLRDGEVRQVGTPEDLYRAARPSRRRRVHGLPQPPRRPRRRVAGGSADVEVGGARIAGTHARAGCGRATAPSSRSGPRICVAGDGAGGARRDGRRVEYPRPRIRRLRAHGRRHRLVFRADAAARAGRAVTLGADAGPRPGLRGRRRR